MRKAPDTVRDIDTWDDLQELDELGENLTQWEIDFVENLTTKLIAGIRLTAGPKAKLAQIREERLP